MRVLCFDWGIDSADQLSRIRLYSQGIDYRVKEENENYANFKE